MICTSYTPAWRKLPLLVRAGVVLEMPAWRESVVVPPF
jgi:hypothetical protein